ncbi:hypothetical protein [Paludisphaera rhizosphaerae]|uniref:hypothetical protein n=1 Tax=Paludisphaera rhizosphaerae TaxID=2711216 RepID=UPI0013EC0650|nr:hypothetical protein [Paludisphaera rhizosphaerae]
MFCPGCGNEIYGDAPNFCPHCGRPQPGAAVAAAQPQQVLAPTGPVVPKKTKKRFLWNYHTFDWVGHCPTCHLAHRWEHVRCPNDDAPMVMAFNCSRWNPFKFPMQTAHLRCLNNCGYTLSGFNCTHDKTLVAGQSVEFRPSILRVFLWNIGNTLMCIIALAFMIPFLLWLAFIPYAVVTGGLAKLEAFTRSTGVFALGMFGFCSIAGKFLWDWWLETWWWKFVRNFDLERVQRR